MTVLLHTDHMNKQLSGTGNAPFHLTRPVPPNTSDLNPADYRISGEMQQRLYELKVNDVDELQQSMSGVAWSQARSMTQ